MKKATFLNISTGLLVQIITILNGFILPKIILEYFGSNVNGLISSINQLLSYIALFEGGLTTIISANIYKPLVEKDYEKLSSIYVTANRFFRKIGYIFIAYSALLSVIYPVIFNNEFTFSYVCSLILILSNALLIQYMFCINMRILLFADKKGYIINITQVLFIIFNFVFSIISLKIYRSIHILKIISAILYLIQPIILKVYIDKFYKINRKAAIDNNLMKGRWDGFAINLACFIHLSTDITLLTTFTDLKTVSIYSIYSIVTNGIKQIILSIDNAFVPVIGQAYANEEFEQFESKFNVHEFLTIVIVCFFSFLCFLLIDPFVMIYTQNINDTNYFQPYFATFLILSEALYLLKSPHLNIAYIAKKFKEITPICYLEALINISISVILVQKIGLIGVAVGTTIAMLFRLIYQIYLSNKIIYNKNNYNFYYKLFLFVLPSIIAFILLKKFLPVHEYFILEWIKKGAIYSVVYINLYLLISFIFFKGELKTITNYFAKN